MTLYFSTVMFENLRGCKESPFKTISSSCRGVDSNEGDLRGERPLDLAARIGSVPVIEVLLSNGADICRRTKNGRTR